MRAAGYDPQEVAGSRKNRSIALVLFYGRFQRNCLYSAGTVGALSRPATESDSMPKYVVRHGVMRNLGVFTPRGRDTFVRGDQVIARTSRGLESGEVLCEATDEAVAPTGRSEAGPDPAQACRATTSATCARCSSRSAASTKSARPEIKRLNLDMQLVDVEHLYGGERVVMYYLAEGRIDFRELVKTLANEFQTRIEMRQIGVRDEAKLLADYGDCGKPVCCNTHLSEMPPVSMKMAKLQRATLDPSKISGRCGRLKCCLRYEYDTYQDLQRELPPVGADIITNTGRARVLAQEILAGQVLVETEDRRRIVIDAADVLTVLKRERSRAAATRRRRGEDASDEPATEELPARSGQAGRHGLPRRATAAADDRRRRSIAYDRSADAMAMASPYTVASATAAVRLRIATVHESWRSYRQIERRATSAQRVDVFSRPGCLIRRFRLENRRHVRSRSSIGRIAAPRPPLSSRRVFLCVRSPALRAGAAGPGPADRLPTTRRSKSSGTSPASSCAKRFAATPSQQYGMLAKSVLNEWGVRTTGDFGEIVFNLIDIGQMKKTDSDRREDFENVFDFDDGLRDAFLPITSD